MTDRALLPDDEGLSLCMGSSKNGLSALLRGHGTCDASRWRGCFLHWDMGNSS
jgi:hypothetical protein